MFNRFLRVFRKKASSERIPDDIIMVLLARRKSLREEYAENWLQLKKLQHDLQKEIMVFEDKMKMLRSMEDFVDNILKDHLSREIEEHTKNL